ncbi:MULTISPECIES: hypothetical protein [unclassified Paraburkholderia]|uniref:hypothetical protein n=1 Tax=unclassified Paraburkholderia TaxID=2615204 RepID=UPI002AB01255|nr:MULTISPECIES: hypothetical protein [unclassified Paraburkholderia]
MRTSPIVQAIVNPKMSGGLSGAHTAVIYGSAGGVGFLLSQWHWWATIFPIVVAFIAQAYFKNQFRHDLFSPQIRKNYDLMADRYHPWPRETLRGRGQRPKGFGRNLRS